MDPLSQTVRNLGTHLITFVTHFNQGIFEGKFTTAENGKISDLQTFKNFLSKFFSFFSASKCCRHNCTTNFFTSFSLQISRFTPFFSTLFHCSSSKFTTTTAQFQFYSCKLHFTTAQIVISCMLKYALVSVEVIKRNHSVSRSWN